MPVTNGYRLPTEAEWEFVARAASTGKSLKYPWGKDLPVVPNTANFAGTEAFSLIGASLADHRDEFPAVAAPALFPPNPLGFYDLAGNVSEWTNDRYISFIASTPVTDPLGPTESKGYTYRGSNWRSTTTTRAAFPVARRRHRGHRCDRIPCRTLRRPRIGPKRTPPCAIFSSACSRSPSPRWRP